jgi:hypothetical protein
MPIMLVIRSNLNLKGNTNPTDANIRCDWTCCDTDTAEVFIGGCDVLINATDNATQCETKFRDACIADCLLTTNGKVATVANTWQHAVRRG